MKLSSDKFITFCTPEGMSSKLKLIHMFVGLMPPEQRAVLYDVADELINEESKNPRCLLVWENSGAKWRVVTDPHVARSLRNSLAPELVKAVSAFPSEVKKIIDYLPFPEAAKQSAEYQIRRHFQQKASFLDNFWKHN